MKESHEKISKKPVLRKHFICKFTNLLFHNYKRSVRTLVYHSIRKFFHQVLPKITENTQLEAIITIAIFVTSGGEVWLWSGSVLPIVRSDESQMLNFKKQFWKKLNWPPAFTIRLKNILYNIYDHLLQNSNPRTLAISKYLIFKRLVTHVCNMVNLN